MNIPPGLDRQVISPSRVVKKLFRVYLDARIGAAKADGKGCLEGSRNQTMVI